MVGVSNSNMCLPTPQMAEDLIFCAKKVITKTDSYTVCDNETGTCLPRI